MENKYYLAIENKPKNYFPIYLPNLKIYSAPNTTKLEEIDAFTRNNEANTIKEAIKEANLLDLDYNMPLVVIYYENKSLRKIDALTKEKNYNMWELISKGYDDKVFLNKIYNFLSNKVEASILSDLKQCQNSSEFIKVLNKLPYPTIRRLYFYLYENR